MLRRQRKLETRTAIIDSTQVRAFGGGGRSSLGLVDRREKCTKYTLLVYRHGVPLVLQSASANNSDHRQLLSTLVVFPSIGGKPGRPKNHPDKLYADAGVTVIQPDASCDCSELNRMFDVSKVLMSAASGESAGSSSVRSAGSKDFGG